MPADPGTAAAPSRLPAYTTALPPWSWVVWRPGLDTWIALASVAGMWVLHLVRHWLTPINPVAAQSLLLFFGAVLLATVLPTWVVWHRMRRDLDDLGLQLRRVWLAVTITVVVGLASLPGFWNAAAAAVIDPVSQSWGQILGMWEPFFLYAWVQLRMRDAFGEIPAPVIAAICYGLYHLGTEPLADVWFRMGFALVLGLGFAVTRTLLTLLPFTWAISSGLIGIARGDVHGVNEIALAAVLLIIQVGIVIFAYRHHPGDRDPDRGRTAPDDRGATEIRARMDRERHRRRDRYRDPS